MKSAAHTLVFFGAGGISYLVYTQIKEWPAEWRRWIAICLAAGLLVFPVFYFGGVSDGNGTGKRALYMLTAALLAFRVFHDEGYSL